MAKTLCALSGVSFHCEHIPRKLYLTARETYHPIFDATYSQLTALTEDYFEGELTDTETYLLYLAYFNNTQLVEFRMPALQTSLTQAIIAQNMPQLVSQCAMIQQMHSELTRHRFALPHYIISQDTRDLSSSKYWIENWEQCYVDYCDAYKNKSEREQLVILESNLERIIKDKTKNIATYAGQFAEWAAKAGSFLLIDCIVSDGQHNDRPILLSEYWKRIIRQCTKKQDVYSIHDADLAELIEHLETTVAVAGNIFSHLLMSILRDAQKTKNNFLNMGDIDVGERGTIYKILDPDSDIEDANKIVLIDTAPLKEPIESEYPSKLAYLRARTKYQMAARYRESDRLRAEDTALSTIARAEATEDAISADSISNAKIGDI